MPPGAPTEAGNAGEAGADPLLAGCWDALLRLRSRLRLHAGPCRWCVLQVAPAAAVAVNRTPEAVANALRVVVLPAAPDAPGGPASAAERPPHEDGDTVLALAGPAETAVLEPGRLPARALAMLRLYLPYSLAALTARRRGRAFAVSHFAQTLDGRIATASGHSQWIGCPENLVHAHRMRALCDAVLVGAATLRRDRPRLTVRHVPGADPVRVVVGTPPLDLACLRATGDAPLLRIVPARREADRAGGGGGEGDGGLAGAGAEAGGGEAPVIALEAPGGRIPGRAILEALYARGILSVLAEGGAATTSALLTDGALDVVQLHISPMILGPGLSSFARPQAALVTEALAFSSHCYVPVGDGMMFVGSPRGERRDGDAGPA